MVHLHIYIYNSILCTLSKNVTLVFNFGSLLRFWPNKRLEIIPNTISPNSQTYLKNLQMQVTHTTVCVFEYVHTRHTHTWVECEKKDQTKATMTVMGTDDFAEFRPKVGHGETRARARRVSMNAHASQKLADRSGEQSHIKYESEFFKINTKIDIGPGLFHTWTSNHWTGIRFKYSKYYQEFAGR